MLLHYCLRSRHATRRAVIPDVSHEHTLAGEISPTKALVDFGNSKVEFPDQEEVALVYFKSTRASRAFVRDICRVGVV